MPVVDSGFRDAVAVLVRRQPQQLHGKMAPSLGEKWQDPIQKAGVLVGWVEPDDSCGFGGKSEDKSSPTTRTLCFRGLRLRKLQRFREM